MALGVVRLSLEKNVFYNIVNVKTTHELINALSNMYDAELQRLPRKGQDGR